MARRGTEAFPDLGAHCDKEDCNQLDFLPFDCDGCGKVFCAEHRTIRINRLILPSSGASRAIQIHPYLLVPFSRLSPSRSPLATEAPPTGSQHTAASLSQLLQGQPPAAAKATRALVQKATADAASRASGANVADGCARARLAGVARWYYNGEPTVFRVCFRRVARAPTRGLAGCNGATMEALEAATEHHRHRAVLQLSIVGAVAAATPAMLP
ncbi:Zinc finger AN1 domain-containing stress-associated protein 17 [Triticum urartu]|uniref:Zinc finger AN1 domain-containing stress-associated protein 17 n=1 Tax=Triticum urartu TaxID=4572 RepID=M7ZHY2_TRIUA|nr:Zinc finger AN1 domain-containing stress-associated protein 17 [Triticum urartu]